MSGGIDDGYSDGITEPLRACPWCWGNGVVMGNGLKLCKCDKCAGRGFLPRSEYNALIEKGKTEDQKLVEFCDRMMGCKP